MSLPSFPSIPHSFPLLIQGRPELHNHSNTTKIQFPPLFLSSFQGPLTKPLGPNATREKEPNAHTHTHTRKRTQGRVLPLRAEEKGGVISENSPDSFLPRPVAKTHACHAREPPKHPHPSPLQCFFPYHHGNK